MKDEYIWMFSTYALLAVCGVFTWYIITYHQPVITENIEDCISKGGVYHSRLNDSRFSDLEYCEIEDDVHYQ